MKKWLPWLFVALFGGEALIMALVLANAKPKPDVFDVAGFGKLPVLLNGRVQPLDSVARNTLLQLRSTQDVPLEEVPSWKFWKHPKKLKPTEWLLEVFMKPEQADEQRVFLIHHPELLTTLKLEDKGAEKSGLRFVAPPLRLCGDNAVMIAWAALERLRLGHSDPLDQAPRPRWPLDGADMRIVSTSP